EAARFRASAPANTTGWPRTTDPTTCPVVLSASPLSRLSTTLTKAPTLKSVAHELVPAKPSFASSCFTPDSSRASLHPPPLRYWRQSVSQPLGANGPFQQSVFALPEVRLVITSY